MMKKEFGLALLALFFLSLNAITGAYAVENENKEKNTRKSKYDYQAGSGCFR